MQLDAEARTETGKGPARRLRSVGRLPAIFYGPETDPIMLSVDYLQVKRMLKGKSSETVVLDLRIDSDGERQSKKVMIKEVQRDPVTRDYLHVDFYEIAMGKELEVEIPIHLINIPMGVSNGGILEHTRRELRVSCLPGDMVDKIEMDVSGLDIGQSIHIRDVSLPPGLKLIDDVSLTIATVVAPSTTAEVEEGAEVEEEAAEPEKEETVSEEES
ncbi:MAG: 50S ribosomal protein L25/general stress protein Ctc [Desulfobacterales bacterium]|nr:50S ribosomal protein L25/general stress protein Ctc [Desulfobacterales bacterium]